jgi:ABC-type transport system involved in cytochrome c biogenesis permease subunit
MMFTDYTNFPFFGILVSGTWIAGALMIWTTIFMIRPVAGRTRVGMVLNADYSEKTRWGTATGIAGNALVISGIVVFAWYITVLWISLGRAPMRTLGETRLWYSFFLGLIGYLTYLRWNYKWFLVYSMMMAVLFIIINIVFPENFSKTLMPALQSPWFVPHVIVYIFAYALLGAASIVAVYGLYMEYFRSFKKRLLHLADNIVYIGFAFLTLGLLFGAVWAKEAWGHYWTWDPKETWAFITWMAYLLYIHFRYFHPKKVRTPLWILALAFVVLLIAWFGVNYLPSAQNSIHVYS